MRRAYSVGFALSALLLGVLWTISTRAETPVHIEISATAACALTDSGEIGCWGFDIPLVHDVPQGTFTDVSLGPNDGCAITAENAVECWGAGYAYAFAAAESIRARDPEFDLDLSGIGQLLPSERTDFVEVTVHPWRHYACARTLQGEIDCWGSPVPDKPAPTGSGFTQLISTGREFCALDAEGATTCWGGMQFERFVAADVGPFVRIAPSGTGLCGVTAGGDVRCRVPESPPAPGPPQPYAEVFRNVHIIGGQGCAVFEDGSLHCRQTHHWCSYYFAPQVEYCPAEQIRFQAWAIPFTTLYEGGPDRETTESRSYVSLFGDQAACAITVEGEIDCWSDFRRGDPRHNVPERFRAQTEPAPPAVEEPEEPPSPSGG